MRYDFSPTGQALALTLKRHKEEMDSVLEGVNSILDDKEQLSKKNHHLEELLEVVKETNLTIHSQMLEEVELLREALSKLVEYDARHAMDELLHKKDGSLEGWKKTEHYMKLIENARRTLNSKEGA